MLRLDCILFYHILRIAYFIIFYIGYTDFAVDRICGRQIVQNKQTQGLHLVYIQQCLHVQTN
jgi:hypothetical protein